MAASAGANAFRSRSPDQVWRAAISVQRIRPMPQPFLCRRRPRLAACQVHPGADLPSTSSRPAFVAVAGRATLLSTKCKPHWLLPSGLLWIPRDKSDLHWPRLIRIGRVPNRRFNHCAAASAFRSHARGLTNATRPLKWQQDHRDRSTRQPARQRRARNEYMTRSTVVSVLRQDCQWAAGRDPRQREAPAIP
jgi:hypothetical protein